MTKLLDFDITASNWKDIVNAVLPINDECRINFNRNGIEIKQVDAANVGMVIIDLPKKCFKAYTVPEPIQVGFSFYEMMDMKLTSVSNRSDAYHKPDDIYSFEIYNEAGLTDELPLFTANIKHGIFSENTQMLDPVHIRKEPKVPETNMDAACEVNKRLLNQTLCRINEYIYLTVNEESKTCAISSKSDIIKWNAPIPCDTISGNGACMYDRVLLKKIIAQCKESEVSIKMSTDYPMTVSFPLCEFGTCTYLLAPRIESE